MSGLDNSRLVRIESKLTRLMSSLGLDSEGNPATGQLVVDTALTAEILLVLDMCLNYLPEGDTPEEQQELDVLYGRGDNLLKRLSIIKESRWPTP